MVGEEPHPTGISGLSTLRILHTDLLLQLAPIPILTIRQRPIRAHGNFGEPLLRWAHQHSLLLL
jgi:hypothetical protein